ncbi:hypothetical protein [Paenibacillus sp. RC84]|uniref:hypothetical protein n=1 Tax=Paenibacillus sp. RC84 TaxID=3156252 RepID=UPI003516416D
MIKKFSAILLTGVLALSLATSAYAANESLQVISEPGEDNTVGSISGQDKEGKFTFFTTQSGGQNFAKAAVLSSCGGAPIDLEIKGVGSITKAIKLSSGCSYKVRLWNETGGTAKAFLRNWE